MLATHLIAFAPDWLMSDRHETCPELPAPPGRIVVFAVLALVGGVMTARWIDRPRGPECVGYLTAHSTSVTARDEGTVAKFEVHEGAAVRIGDQLLTLRDDDLTREIAAKQREIASLQSELSRTLAEAELELDWRLRTIEAEICDIQLRSAGFLKEKFDFELQRNMIGDLLVGGEIAMLETPQELFSASFLESRPDRAERLTSALRMEVASNAAEVSAAQVEICELRQKNLELLKKELPNHVRRKVGVDVAESRLKLAKEELAQLEQRQNELLVNSPAIGKVGTFYVHEGDYLVPGQRIVELLDESRRDLIVHVPSREIAAFPVGLEVELTFSGGVSRSGKVVSIAPQATKSPIPGGDPIVLVQVEPAGAVWPQLPIGSQVSVHPAK